MPFGSRSVIGIFDSGVGGFCAYRRVRELLPGEEIIFLADGKNSPYGIKTEEEITEIAEKNIAILRSVGADKILIACCTASSVYHRLSHRDREIAVPIIEPAARLAARGKNIAVIATRHTATSHAFGREIAKYTDAPVSEYDEQGLVRMIESGARGRRIGSECRRHLASLAHRIKMLGADTLILGCTHFTHVEGALTRLLPRVRIISPATVGAEYISQKFMMTKQGR